jgi:hypothetical protein
MDVMDLVDITSNDTRCREKFPESGVPHEPGDMKTGSRKARRIWMRRDLEAVTPRQKTAPGERSPVNRTSGPGARRSWPRNPNVGF